MLLDARNSNEVPDFVRGDVVIVGAGTVGLFLAISLTRANQRVVVLDTGGRVADTIRSAQTAVSLGKVQKGLTLGRAFGLGGTSTLWGGQLAEFDAFDLTVQGREWPIEYSELQQWYEHIYRFFDLERREPLSSYRQKFGNETESESDIERFFTHWLPQPNFAVLFRKEIISNPLLTIILNATANDILFEGSCANTVCANSTSGRRFRVSGNQLRVRRGHH